VRHPTLGAILAATSAALVLATVIGAGLAGVLALRRLADEQALARVELAGAAAQQEITAEGARVVTVARILAERPTLRSLVRAGRVAELESFLDDFRRTSGLDGAAALVDGRVFAGSGDLDWSALGPLADGVRSAPSSGPRSSPLLTARVRVAEADAEVVAVVRLDDELMASVARTVGLPVLLLTSTTVEADAPGARRLERANGHYLDRRPLLDNTGVTVASVETRLDAATVDASLRRVSRTLLLTAIGAAAAVLAVGLWLGRYLLQPLTRLGEAARRLGRGDLRTPVPSEGGAEVASLAATLEDSRRRLLDLTTELRRREVEARAILEGIVEGVFAVDDSRRITYLSPQAASLLGVAPEQALGRFCGDVLRPAEQDGKRPCQDACPIVHARSRGSARATEQVAGAGSIVRRVVITSSPPVDGRQVQVLRDETGEEANRRLRDNILANLTHELRTPLAAQLASIELLGDGIETMPSEGVRELVSALERSTLRLTRLIDNLLASVRLESGHWPARFEPVALDEVAREAAAMLAPLFRQRRQNLRFEVAAALPPARCDRTQLTHVLLNLLANANRFAPDDSTVSVTARASDGAVSLSIEDEGPGLPPGNARELFQRWTRPAGQEVGQGVGLGLSIVRAILERHGGSVAAESRAEGGARFTVKVPVHHTLVGAAAPTDRAVAS
jgi:signal transduction histidine kinase